MPDTGPGLVIEWLIDWLILFNDDHVIQLRDETVAVRRRMYMVLDNYDGQMNLGGYVV